MGGIHNEGVVSLNSENGAVTLTSTGSTVAITKPSANTINLEASVGPITSSVSNSDGTLTISPTTGDVVASLNLTNPNTWNAVQIFDQSVGMGQASPQAQAHITPTVTLASTVSAGITIGLSGFGYSFSSGDKDYNVYGENSALGQFSPPASTTFVEPPSSNYDPLDPSAANFNFGSSGYTESGYDFGLTVWALYGGSILISVGVVTISNTGPDGNDGFTSYGVNFNWTAPLVGSPDAYLVQLTGSNPNSGSYQVISGTGFTDTNSGWGSLPSYTILIYQVEVTWISGGAPVDNFTVANVTDNTWTTTSGSTLAIDASAWTPGAAPVTPTGNIKALIVDGALVDINSLSYSMPSAQANGYLRNNSVGALTWQLIGPPDVSGFTANQVVYGSNSGFGNLAQSPNLLFNGVDLTLNGSAIFTPVTSTSTGTINNVSTFGINSYRFNNNVSITGFGTPANGKLLWISAPSGLTLKHENTGSTAANRITCPTATDLVVPATSMATLKYDGTSARWLVISSGKPDVTVIANTWSVQQTFNTTAPIFSTMTLGSVLFAGTSGLLSQDNSNFFWDTSNKSLDIGTNTSLKNISAGAFGLTLNGDLNFTTATTRNITTPNATIATGALNIATGTASGSNINSGALTLSVGAAGNSIVGTSSAGVAGALTISIGNSGSATATTSGSVNVGGTGATLSILGSNGGAAGNSTIVDVGGDGGPITIRSGTGGTTTNGGAAFNAGGAGGNLNISAGAGGAALTGVPSGNSAGNGGNILIITGVGGASGSNGVNGGNAGSGQFNGGSGGNSTGTGSSSNIGGNGGGFSFTGGSGGIATGGVSVNTYGGGGNISFAGGFTNGNANGGNISFAGGLSGASNGGSIYFVGGAGTTPGSIYLGIDGGSNITSKKTGIYTLSPQAGLHLANKLASNIGFIVQGFTSQSADLQEWQNSSAGVLAAISSSGVFTLGLAGSQTGTINFNGTTSGTLTLNSAAAAGTWTMTLPTGAGSSGQHLITNGSGVTSWSSVLPTVTTVSLTGQTSDIGSTNFTGANVAGLYRVHYSLEDTASDITAGAVTLSIAYTADAGAISIPSAAQVLTGTGLTQGTIFVQLASGSISYSTSHTGLFGSAQYAVYMTVERLK